MTRPSRDRTPSSRPNPSTTVARAAATASAAASKLAEMAFSRRAELLEAVAERIEAHSDELVEIANAETFLGEVRLIGEVARTSNQLRLFADVVREGSFLEVTIDHADPSATPPRPDLRRYLVPLGPVAVFTASNFPFAFSVVGGDTAAALAAGCSVVVKAHSGHTQLSRRTAQIAMDALSDAGAPPGTLAHVEGHQAGRDLVTSPAIRAVGFTGSLEGGRALFDLAAGRPDPIPFYGELGSINPIVIAPGAAKSRAGDIAADLVQSFTLGGGQFCTKPGVVFVPAMHDLVTEVSEAVAGTESVRMLTPRIRDNFHQGIRDLDRIEGVRCVAGSSQQSGDRASPVVFVTDCRSLREDPGPYVEERFGPAVLLVRYSSLADLMETTSVLPGSLATALHALPSELPDLKRLVDRLGEISGRVILDGWPTGVAVTWSMHHGGPWPATTDPLHTSVGATAIRRFLRPVTFQNMDPSLLPPELHDDNPLEVPRRVNGHLIG